MSMMRGTYCSLPEADFTRVQMEGLSLGEEFIDRSSQWQKKKKKSRVRTEQRETDEMIRLDLHPDVACAFASVPLIFIYSVTFHNNATPRHTFSLSSKTTITRRSCDVSPALVSSPKSNVLIGRGSVVFGDVGRRLSMSVEDVEEGAEESDGDAGDLVCGDVDRSWTEERRAEENGERFEMADDLKGDR